MFGKQDLYQLIGVTAFDRDGTKLGSVDTVFVDRETEAPTFAAVTTGLFGTKSSFVPLADANFRDGELHVAYPRERVNDAPTIDADDTLDPEQEVELYRYYGIPVADTDETDDTDHGDADSGRVDAQAETGSGAYEGAATAGAAAGAGGGAGATAVEELDEGRAVGQPVDTDLPTGTDLISGQGFDPMFDGPLGTPNSRVRLRRVGRPVEHADDPRAARAEQDPEPAPERPDA
ncbi:PRC-barrel domain-containing protein [Egicoccus halophilus]|uniref:PRC-barrel domain-containing protein n=1 Tax=Egicoccus halophilus TaxID=1670830 RepID=A0A8J3AAM6_9ACTN|nr:PRC-barrel domain-containing protein [Egicoccus halophilus]GGI06602.1 hypothetical protein GCM10011354_19910 [Egicoccus halophilus]